MSWSPGYPQELVGEPRRFLFQRDFASSALCASRLTPIRLKSEFGDAFVPLMMDITDAEAVHQAAQRVGSMIGDRNLVGLVNNAGIVVSGPLLYLKHSEYPGEQVAAQRGAPRPAVRAKLDKRRPPCCPSGPFEIALAHCKG
jgi:NAD(P)-dependent dehydrogenase (short-subunit alcohol dehydrogenase family)